MYIIISKPKRIPFAAGLAHGVVVFPGSGDVGRILRITE